MSFDSIIDLPAFSLRIPQEDAEKLPEILLAVPEERRQEMRRAMARVWQRCAGGGLGAMGLRLGAGSWGLVVSVCIAGTGGASLPEPRGCYPTHPNPTPPKSTLIMLQVHLQQLPAVRQELRGIPAGPRCGQRPSRGGQGRRGAVAAGHGA